MQKTVLLRRLLRLFKTGKFFYTILLLTLAARSVQAGEPIVTFAMVQMAGKISESTHSSETNSLFDQKNSTAEAVKVDNEKAIAAKPVIPTEIKTNFFSSESFFLIRENLHSRSNKFVTVQAGYGQIWDEKSMLQKISCGHQESGCAYVSANFSF